VDRACCALRRLRKRAGGTVFFQRDYTLATAAAHGAFSERAVVIHGYAVQAVIALDRSLFAREKVAGFAVRVGVGIPKSRARPRAHRHASPAGERQEIGATVVEMGLRGIAPVWSDALASAPGHRNFHLPAIFFKVRNAGSVIFGENKTLGTIQQLAGLTLHL